MVFWLTEAGICITLIVGSLTVIWASNREWSKTTPKHKR